MYDYVIVGSGLFGCVFAHEMHKAGRQCLVLERRDQVGGNVYCEEKDGIHIHRYGAHIFHTSDPRVWEYVNQFAKFNHFINTPVANYKGELYNLPFNMNTFAKMWGIITPRNRQRPRLKASAGQRASRSRRTWKNRPFPSSARMCMRN
ncbi:MAG: NAD(P)-binding protein [Megasphaera elsdenii]|nr:NAD(P)-binding protein [Megasphaera elsdenii]